MRRTSFFRFFRSQKNQIKNTYRQMSMLRTIKRPLLILFTTFFAGALTGSIAGYTLKGNKKIINEEENNKN